VADQDHRHAAVPNPPDRLQHLAALHHAERRGRLVHEDDPAGVGHRPGHRDRLALAPGQAGHWRAGVGQVDTQLGERGHRLAPHLRPVEDPQERDEVELPAQVQVGRRVQVRGQGEVLIDRLDAVLPGVERAGQVHRLAADADFAAVRADGAGQHLDQGALTRAVVTDERHDLARVHREAGTV